MNQVAKMHLRDKMYLSQNMKIRRLLMDGLRRTWNTLRNKSKIRPFFFLKDTFRRKISNKTCPHTFCAQDFKGSFPQKNIFFGKSGSEKLKKKKSFSKSTFSKNTSKNK